MSLSGQSQTPKHYSVLWREILTLKRRIAELFALVGEASGGSGGGGGGSGGSTGPLGSWLESGGQVTWESAYTFRVSAAVFYINGTRYTSAETTVTLDAADASLDRLDLIVLTTSGVADKLTGTPAAQPSEPDINPATQLKLSLVLVEAATTQPPAVSNVTLYAENTGGPGEWNWSVSNAAWNLNSTTNPRSGTKDIEGTALPSGAYVQGQTPSGTIDPNAYQTLILFLRSKATWNSTRGLTVTFRLAGVLKGAPIDIRRTGTYGFDSSLTTGYQQVAIPIADFAIPSGTLIDQVRIADFGGSIGVYMDDLRLQVGTSQPTEGITQAQADARYAPLGPSFVTVNAEAGLPNERRLVAGTGISLVDGGSNTTLTVNAVSGGAGINQLTGDVTAGPGVGSQAATIAADAVTNTKLANMAAGTVKGRALGAGTGDPTDLSAAQLKAIVAPELEATIGATMKTAGELRAVYVPHGFTVTGWVIFADVSGSAVVDVWNKATYPPTVAETIAGSEKPTLSSQLSNSDFTLTTWTTSIASGTWVAFKLESITTATEVTVQLIGKRT